MKILSRILLVICLVFAIKASLSGEVARAAENIFKVLEILPQFKQSNSRAWTTTTMATGLNSKESHLWADRL